MMFGRINYVINDRYIWGSGWGPIGVSSCRFTVPRNVYT